MTCWELDSVVLTLRGLQGVYLGDLSAQTRAHLKADNHEDGEPRRRGRSPVIIFHANGAFVLGKRVQRVITVPIRHPTIIITHLSRAEAPPPASKNRTRTVAPDMQTGHSPTTRASPSSHQWANTYGDLCLIMAQVPQELRYSR